MDESALVGLAAYRAFDATLALRFGETCPHAPGGALVREVVEGARNLLEAFRSSILHRPGACPARVGPSGVTQR